MTKSVTGSLSRGFAARVIEWQQRAGRHHLPWQNTTDAYVIWLSEIMLQQTQVATVIPYFQRFLERFPSVANLASSSEEQVLEFWSGLGYYARARNLRRAAHIVMTRFSGQFPERFEDILSLPGVGRSTAGAIAVFAYGKRFPILDGNVKRLLARCFSIEGVPSAKKVADQLWQLAESLVPNQGVQAYTQGLMDLGTQVCVRSRPMCEECPLSTQCIARSQNRVSELPTPRPSKRRRHRCTVMLILECDGEIMLEKRPAPGIWGGLWSFPEIDNVDDAVSLCMMRFGAEIKVTEMMAPLEHGFTHYSLKIAPLRCRVSQRSSLDGEPGRMWVRLGDVTSHAIPVPVRKLVTQLSQSV